jgi:hypothetical protein
MANRRLSHFLVTALAPFVISSMMLAALISCLVLTDRFTGQQDHLFEATHELWSCWNPPNRFMENSCS